MGKFSSDAKKLLDYVGGKENIKAVTHCVTRMAGRGQRNIYPIRTISSYYR